jgi:monosaccharide-transporting ATPase
VLLISSETEELVDGADRVIVLRDGVTAAELRGAEVTTDALLRAIAAEPPEATTEPDADPPPAGAEASR